MIDIHCHRYGEIYGCQRLSLAVVSAGDADRGLATSIQSLENLGAQGAIDVRHRVVELGGYDAMRMEQRRREADASGLGMLRGL